MVGETAFPVFEANGEYTPNLVSSGVVEFIQEGTESVQSREIRKGLVSLPKGARIQKITRNTAIHTLDIIAKMGVPIIISPK